MSLQGHFGSPTVCAMEGATPHRSLLKALLGKWRPGRLRARLSLDPRGAGYLAAQIAHRYRDELDTRPMPAVRVD